MHFMQLRVLPAAILFFLAFMAGCGGPPGPKADIERVVPVSGTLTYKGAPLDSYQVSFRPTDGRRPAVGVTDAQGKFTLGTNEAGDGAPPGMCKVAVVWVAPPSTDPPGQETVIDDPALLPKPSVQIPPKYGNPETSGLTQDVPESGITDLKIDLE
jgi:hypothetical protein